ncbi:hypothetical protein [Streptacidiphilus jiangxiensis]|uniref:Uncharacterized protein n=1 Tax=Streptacidiphilus jiangxiensis TaxID=235985 RepID=A0A1H7UCX6_STRJI|nr:hypothetical protein [Streptacidiphilus jiangxiensis]SEL94912.1 hypothetical protein SAMN05414137_115224 [Streptacidiphilus jiangxiensis]
MLAVFLFLLLIAVVCGFLGVIVKGLFWLLIIGCVVFVLAVLFVGLRLGRRLGRRDAAKHSKPAEPQSPTQP